MNIFVKISIKLAEQILIFTKLIYFSKRKVIYNKKERSLEKKKFCMILSLGNNMSVMSY